MKGASVHVSHDYDPNLVFRNYSANIPHLKSWVDDLVKLTETSLPQTATPNTDTLVNALQRYDVIFKELLRQTTIFSEPIAEMLAKAWSGALKLLMYMIKSYHKYVKQTSHLQDQAQTLLAERIKDEAATKVQKEEFEMDRTALRASMRNTESELESMKTNNKFLVQENKRLRSIIETYIKSADFNDPVWDILDPDDVSPKTESKMNRRQSDSNDDSLTDDNLGFKRREILDAGKHSLKTLNRLDIELNEILANILKEENRQRLLMKDLIKLIGKHKDIFLFAPEQLEKVNNKESLGNLEKVKKVNAGQGEMKLSAIKDAIRLASLKRLAFMTSALGTNQDETELMKDVAIQVDEKDDIGMTIDQSEDHYTLDILQLGVAPLAPSNAFSPGADIPFQLRKCMINFPKVLRIPPAAATCQSILAIYFDKIVADEERKQRKLTRQSLPLHLHNYLLRCYGVHSTADTQASHLVVSCEANIRKHPRIALFASQLGLSNKEEMPVMDVRDTDFILQTIKMLQKQGELQSELQKAGKKKDLTHLSVHIKSDITRQSALHVVSQTFEKWLPDNGEDYMIKVRTMQNSDQGQRFVDLDIFLDMLIEPWHTVRSCWEEHARYLFQEHCSVYQVLQEAQFANDEGKLASDSILAEIHKSTSGDCVRRPVRMFQKKDQIDGDGTSGNNSNKETACETMNKKKFIECLKLVNPTLSTDEIEHIFEEALEIAHNKLLRCLELLWKRFIDDPSNYTFSSHHSQQEPSRPSTESGTELVALKQRQLGTYREFWVNTKSNISQWTKPYRPRTFRTHDLEVDTFTDILIQMDVFPQCPFIEYLHINPKDFWPNAEMFYKQLKTKQEFDKHRNK